MDQKDFGEFFSEVRKLSGFNSQRKLAIESGISNGTIARIEDGTQKAKPETLKILSNHLKASSYGELMKNAGYLENYSEFEMEDQLAKFDFADMIDEQFEKIIFSQSISENEFSPEFKEFIQRLFSDKHSENKQINEPRFLVNAMKESQDLTFKLELYNDIFEYVSLLETKSTGNTNDMTQIDLIELQPFKNRETYIKVPVLIDPSLSLETSVKDFEEIQKDILKDRKGFVLNSTDDDGMLDEGITKNTKLICVQQDYLKPSDIGVLCIKDSSKFVLRKVEFLEESILLIASNSSIKPEVFPKSAVKIVGRVIQSIRTHD